MIQKVNCIEDIYKQLEGIQYGWMDLEKNIYYENDKGFKKKYILASPEEVLENKIGTSFDITELERSYFKNLGLKFNAFFMAYYDSKRIIAHTFIVYEEDEKFYWFEYAWDSERFIHSYMSLYDLLTDVRSKFKQYNNIKFMDLDYLCIYKYRKPKYHIGLKDFYKHCESGENVLI